VQVCAQALCLEEMLGVEIPTSSLWFAGNRRRADVELDVELRELTESTIHAVRRLFDARILPPAPSDERCQECQLLSYCLPGLVSEPVRLQDYMMELYACR
jgi:CRISPR-associated exonuclease Cas4